MNLFQILAIDCNTPLVNAIITGTKVVFTLIQWGIPLVLIVLCTIDMFKAMASGDEKKTKEVQSTCIRRLIYAVVAFLIPFIIDLVFGFIGNVVSDDSADDAKNTWNTFFACWKGNASYSGGSTNDGGSSSSGNENCDPTAIGYCVKDMDSYEIIDENQCECYSGNHFWFDE